MAIPKFMEDLNIISKIGDRPGSDSGLSTPQFKAKFDEGILKIQKYLNEKLIPGIEGAVNEEGLLAQVNNVLEKKLNLSGGTMTGSVNMNKKSLYGLRTPSDATEAVPKSYADNIRDTSEKKKLSFFDVEVPVSAFTENYNDTDYPVMGAISLEGANANMISEVYFSIADALSGNYSPVSTTYNNGVRIYASEKPDSSVVIPAIILWREE